VSKLFGLKLRKQFWKNYRNRPILQLFKYTPCRHDVCRPSPSHNAPLTHITSISFFAFFCELWENRLRIEITLINSYLESKHELFKDTNSSPPPQLHPLSSVGSKIWRKKCNKWYVFSTIKLYNSPVKFIGLTTSSGKAVWACICSERNQKTFFESNAYLRISQRCQCWPDPLIEETLYIQNGCVDLHVWHIEPTRFKSRQICFARECAYKPLHGERVRLQ